MKHPTPIKNIVPKLPKLTKEQKIASRAKSLIWLARNDSKTRASINSYLDEALGLLEALTTTDDTEKENENLKTIL